MDEDERFAVRAVTRRDVVAALESHALGLALRVGAHAVNLRTSRAIRGEQNVLAVTRETGLGIDGLGIGKPRNPRTVGVDRVDVRAAVLGQHHRQFLAIRGPCGRGIRAFEIGQDHARSIEQVVHEHDRLSALEGNVGDAGPIRRPLRRDDRFLVCQDEFRVVAVGIGYLQFETIRVLGYEANLGGEYADVAGQFLVDKVGNLVGGDAQLRNRHRVGKTEDLRLLCNIHQAKSHFGITVRFLDHAADDQRFGALVLPVTVVDLGGLRRKRPNAAHRTQFEHAAALQIRGDDLAGALIEALFTRKRQDCDWNLVGPATDDFDGQLRRSVAHATKAEQQTCQKEKITESFVYSSVGRVHRRKSISRNIDQSFGRNFRCNSRKFSWNRSPSGTGNGCAAMIARSTAAS